jgi:hypothetical protein
MTEGVAFHYWRAVPEKSNDKIQMPNGGGASRRHLCNKRQEFVKLGLRIFGCYVVIFCLCFAWPVGWMPDSLRTRYLEGVEDPLVDQANILAGRGMR